MHMKTLLAALSTTVLMTGCIIAPDDHYNQPGHHPDSSYSRPPAHDQGGLRPGETTHDRTDPGYSHPSGSNNGGLRPGETSPSNQVDPGFSRPSNPGAGFGR